MKAPRRLGQALTFGGGLAFCWSLSTSYSNVQLWSFVALGIGLVLLLGD